MSSEDKQGGAKSIPTVSHILPTGEIVELVYGAARRHTSFAVGSSYGAGLVESVDLEGGARLVPWSAESNLIKRAVVLLPERPEEFGTLGELVSEIDTYLYRYVDLSDGFRKIAAYYILLTWVYDAFNELPYLRLRGDYGTGKTRALLVIGSLCYKAFIASGASTVSPIFHILNTFRGTLVLDEADFRFSDEKAELSKILNNGNVRDFPVLRTMVNQKKEFDPTAFDVYGPKIVAMRKSFEDAALESRFITEEMGERPLRTDIPINLPNCQKSEALALRNKLLAYRFAYFSRITVDDTLVNRSLSPRLNQILVPLLSIVDDEHLRDEIRSVAHSLEEDLAAERNASTEAQLLEVIMSLMEGKQALLVRNITKVFIGRFASDYERPITNRYIGSLLRKSLHLKTYKTSGAYVVALKDTEKLKTLCARYGVPWPEVKKPLNSTTQSKAAS